MRSRHRAHESEVITNTMQALDLDRFSVCCLLGHGASYEVYDAIDRESGQSVVLKRPWAQCLRGGQYRYVDEQSARLIEVHHLLHQKAPHVSPLIGYAERGRHDQYFGDGLPQEYYVLIEARARGVPLVADIKDKFRGVPIGLNQNLFALYPLVGGNADGTVSIFDQLLDVEEAFMRIDHLILDLRPQNVYFDPKRRRVTVIDLGMCVDIRGQISRRTPLDVHNCLAELCKYYLAPDLPPAHIRGYREAYGMGPDLGFDKELERMIHACARLPDGPLQDVAVGILQRIKRRDYGGIALFRQDWHQYVALRDARNRSLPEYATLAQVWREGLAMLQDNYWRKFLFNPDADLTSYV
jgi:hypothetical protein